MDDLSSEELDRICGNCNYSFPANEGISTEAICLKEPEFEPYVERLLDKQDFSCCADLIKSKCFPLNREACDDFDPVELIGEDAGFSSELSEDIEALEAEGRLTPENLEAAFAAESFRRTDWSQVPVDDYIGRLYSAATIDAREEAHNGFGFLISQDNRAAFDALIAYLRDLPPPQKPVDCHFRSEVLRQLSWRHEYEAELARVIVEDLFRTPSNNHTRPWYTAVWRFFERCSPEVAEEALRPILNSPQFSYRIKRRVKGIIDYGNRYAYS